MSHPVSSSLTSNKVRNYVLCAVGFAKIGIDVTLLSHNHVVPCMLYVSITGVRIKMTVCGLWLHWLAPLCAHTLQVHGSRYHHYGGRDIWGLLRRRLHGPSPGSWFHGSLWSQLSQWVFFTASVCMIVSPLQWIWIQIGSQRPAFRKQASRTPTSWEWAGKKKE